MRRTIIGNKLQLLPGQRICVTVDGRGEKLKITAGFERGFTVETLPAPPAEDRSVVRINIAGMPYAYRLGPAERAEIGDWVRVLLPSGEPHYAKVKAFGRGNYTGDLKTAYLAT